MLDKKERIIKCISEQGQHKLSDITLDSNLILDLDLDSLDCVELGLRLEDEFGIEGVDLSECKTALDVIEHVINKGG